MSTRRSATHAGFAAIVVWASLALLATFTAAIPPFQQLALGFGVAGAAGLAWTLRPGGDGIAALRQPPASAALTIAALFGYHALYFVALKRALRTAWRAPRRSAGSGTAAAAR